jgi:hypothetical protein
VLHPYAIYNRLNSAVQQLNQQDQQQRQDEQGTLDPVIAQPDADWRQEEHRNKLLPKRCVVD